MEGEIIYWQNGSNTCCTIVDTPAPCMPNTAMWRESPSLLKLNTLGLGNLNYIFRIKHSTQVKKFDSAPVFDLTYEIMLIYTSIVFQACADRVGVREAPWFRSPEYERLADPSESPAQYQFCYYRNRILKQICTLAWLRHHPQISTNEL